jgi:hypothetical protein
VNDYWSRFREPGFRETVGVAEDGRFAVNLAPGRYVLVGHPLDEHSQGHIPLDHDATVVVVGERGTSSLRFIVSGYIP